MDNNLTAGITSQLPKDPGPEPTSIQLQGDKGSLTAAPVKSLAKPAIPVVAPAIMLDDLKSDPVLPDPVLPAPTRLLPFKGTIVTQVTLVITPFGNVHVPAGTVVLDIAGGKYPVKAAAYSHLLNVAGA